MQLEDISSILKKQIITTSAPCRIDFGGTLDISSFHYPLRKMTPSTVNIALDLRTTVTLSPVDDDRIHISSAGFSDAVFHPFTAPYNHPLGLMFAVADYFAVRGVHIKIHSTSPPKSGLGGSSVAAVALIAAFSRAKKMMGQTEIPKKRIALLAHAIEQGAAGIPCGIQDQLAAAFGGVNAWLWPADPSQPPFLQQPLLKNDCIPLLDKSLLVAYLGVTHISRDVNSTWVNQFISGHHREKWRTIAGLTLEFAHAVKRLDMKAAADVMNRETTIRKALTPQVLEEMGDRLWAAAIQAGCGARFTGAGGGGCLWAIGEADNISALKPEWENMLSQRPTAGLIQCHVDSRGVT